ncbi:hypothetical protein AYI68_g8099, partial [Smittium mucronatum]
MSWRPSFRSGTAGDPGGHSGLDGRLYE